MQLRYPRSGLNDREDITGVDVQAFSAEMLIWLVFLTRFLPNWSVV